MILRRHSESGLKEVRRKRFGRQHLSREGSLHMPRGRGGPRLSEGPRRLAAAAEEAGAEDGDRARGGRSQPGTPVGPGE